MRPGSRSFVFDEVGRLRFLGAEEGEAKIVLFGVPLEATESFRGGTRFAPNAIREASQSIESYSRVFRGDLEELGLADVGNVEIPGGVAESIERVSELVRSWASEDKRIVMLGGEHTITLGAVGGMLEALGRLQVVVLDAHSDFRKEYLRSSLCHATVCRRLHEMGVLVGVAGVRSFFGGEGEEFEELLCHIEDITFRLDPHVPLYLSVDLDALDPSICPGVSNPEPGGLSYVQVLELFGALRDFEVVGMDIVEGCPPCDPSGITMVVAAKLVQEGTVAFWRGGAS
ncbi:MAG TPA: agmatinase [Candidatus Latescibacteria bacterium]|nr:agmatinase [Candidatus Latescibacterota bacterium]